jgi:hypothetical protein
MPIVSMWASTVNPSGKAFGGLTGTALKIPEEQQV